MYSMLTAPDKVYRHSFGKSKNKYEIPNLLEMHRNFYKEFLQKEIPAEKRKNVGLQAVLSSIFPIYNYSGTAALEFEKYEIGEPQYDYKECILRGETYDAPLKIRVRLLIMDVDEETEEKTIRDIKEQDVYLGDIPLMTDKASFIINGVEKAVVSQLHRSPGVFYSYDEHQSGKILYTARVIPYRGSWLDFEFNQKDQLFCRIDRKRKIFLTTFLRALGLGTNEILNSFYKTEIIHFLDSDKFARELDIDLLAGVRADADVTDIDGNLLVRKNRKFTRAQIKKIKEKKINKISIEEDAVYTKYSAEDIFDPNTGEVILEVNEQLTKDVVKRLKESGINSVKVLYIDGINYGPFIRDTIAADKVATTEDALIEIYQRLRPSDPPTLESAELLFNNLFFNPARYDLSEVGRVRINYKFGYTDVPVSTTTLRKEDIIDIVRYLLDLRLDNGVVDDVDHLGNRRIRAVGELLENQLRVGLARMERMVKEKMSLQDVEAQMPNHIINSKPVASAIREFFATSQFSQFMDQTNPLAELTHKRRLSALGPGGLSRDRAGFEVRDVHTTHYGRICPIETPEGPNIGLISSVTTLARINKYGFLETPYREVHNRQVSKTTRYLSALEEWGHVIAPSDTKLDSKGNIADDFVKVRHNGQYLLKNSDEVTLIDIAPVQLVSVAASLIPFLEHDDANRALMGSNMQRQAVPCVNTDAPVVGTGIERMAAISSGVVVECKRSGVVESVDANRIVVVADGIDLTKKTDDLGVDIYYLDKYKRTNQDTCANQRVLVKVGDKVKKGDILADGHATDMGELALGHNVFIGFMSWGGYNFEDAVLISEELIHKDIFTSIHIEEYECVARDTKLGKEEITRDIPNVGDDALKNLDESGIVRIGSEVNPGDIIVGKITPKGESQLSAEERLLRAIFGEKAKDVKDTSLRAGPGVRGIVVGATVFSREGIEDDYRLKEIKEQEREKIERDRKEELKVVRSVILSQLYDVLLGENLTDDLFSEDGSEILLKKGEKITQENLAKVPFELMNYIPLSSEVEKKVYSIIKIYRDKKTTIDTVYDAKIDDLNKIDELPPGVVKIVRVRLAIKRKLSVGDKMAGRHGNKGVISKILPIEDMPYTEAGEPLQIVLNPLGVPSRMNIGQVFELNLGFAAKGIMDTIQRELEKFNPDNLRKYIKGIYSSKKLDKIIDEADEDTLKKIASKLANMGVLFSTHVFDGATEKDIKRLLKHGGLPESGKIKLIDGRTGEPFDNEVTVGIMYFLKLHHLVDNKIHARATGPYSLITQQPLGGKAQFGGQRLGEMEVWAMEAYGASYALQEFMTVKADDIAGRTRIYESIVKGNIVHEPGIPESFKVLTKELKSLALNIEMITK